MNLAKDRIINEVGQEFNTAFPFLKIDFFKYSNEKPGLSPRQKLNRSISLANAGIRREGEIEISETITVKQLEKNFLDQFGLSVQVSRRSGGIWLETTMSDNWTLKQQNEHGQELSEPIKSDVQPDRFDHD